MPIQKNAGAELGATVLMNSNIAKDTSVIKDSQVQNGKPVLRDSITARDTHAHKDSTIAKDTSVIKDSPAENGEPVLRDSITTRDTHTHKDSPAENGKPILLDSITTRDTNAHKDSAIKKNKPSLKQAPDQKASRIRKVKPPPPPSRHSLRHVSSGDGWRVLAYRPTCLKPFAINMEELTPRRRVRFLLERMAGYRVYYLFLGETLAGYTVIARGGSWRYGFSCPQDIIVGPYFIDESFRGRRFSILLNQEAMALWRYDNAYMYIEKENKISFYTSRSLGFELRSEAKVARFTRKVTAQADGSHWLMAQRRTLHG